MNAAQNAGILAAEMLALGDDSISIKLKAYKEDLKQKIVKANVDLAMVKYNYKVN